MDTIRILGELIQLGGISASLAFLYLGYQLLQNEQNLRDSQGNLASARPEVLSSIRTFLLFSLAFFVLGVFAYAGIYLLERNYPRDDLVHLTFSDFELDPRTRIFRYAFSERRIGDLATVRNDKKTNYKAYLIIRAQASKQFLEGEFPVLLGPFRYETISQRTESLTEDQLARLGNGCVDYFLFGYIGADELKIDDATKVFKPLAYAAKVTLFDGQFSCP